MALLLRNTPESNSHVFTPFHVHAYATMLPTPQIIQIRCLNIRHYKKGEIRKRECLSRRVVERQFTLADEAPGARTAPPRHALFTPTLRCPLTANIRRPR